MSLALGTGCVRAVSDVALDTKARDDQKENLNMQTQ